MTWPEAVTHCAWAGCIATLGYSFFRYVWGQWLQ